MNIAIKQSLAVLDIPYDTPYDKAKSLYRKKLVETHPDKGGTQEKFIQITRAWEIVESYLQTSIETRHPDTDTDMYTRRHSSNQDSHITVEINVGGIKFKVKPYSQNTRHFHVNLSGMDWRATQGQAPHRDTDTHVRTDADIVDGLPLVTLYESVESEGTRYARHGRVVNTSEGTDYTIVVSYLLIAGEFFVDPKCSFVKHVPHRDAVLKHRHSHHIRVHKTVPSKWAKWDIVSPYYEQ